MKASKLAEGSRIVTLESSFVTAFVALFSGHLKSINWDIEVGAFHRIDQFID